MPNKFAAFVILAFTISTFPISRCRAQASAPTMPGLTAPAVALSTIAASAAPVIAWPPASDLYDQSGQQQQKQQQAKPKPGAPPQPSLQDLGIAPSAAKANPQEQARLDRRSHMLQIHQRLGLITGAAMLATLLVAGGANQRKGTSGGRALHATLGGVTTGLYAATAYYAIAAPKIKGVKTRGPIRVHKFLAWIHGTGMILTPILGSMAYAQIDRGERVHGIARYHGAVATATFIAYAAAIASVSFKF